MQGADVMEDVTNFLALASDEVVDCRGHGLLVKIDTTPGKNQIVVMCPLCDAWATTITMYLDSMGRKKKNSRTVSSCGCAVEICRDCRRTFNPSRRQQKAGDFRRWVYLCFGGGHFGSLSGKREEPAPARNVLGPAGRTTAEEADAQLLEGVKRGLVGCVTRTARGVAQVTAESVASQTFAHLEANLQAWAIATLEKMYPMLVRFRDLPNSSGGNGLGHLVKPATAKDLLLLVMIRDCGEEVEAVVAGKKVGDHFLVTFDTDKAREEGGWMLMATGIHCIAFAAAGDLDPRASDVFSAEDIGGGQPLAKSERQGEVREDQRRVLPSGDHDGTVVFMSRSEVVDAGRLKEVMGLRMGEMFLSNRERQVAQCYTRAGFCDSGVLEESINDRASAMKAMAEDWRDGALERIDIVESEVATVTKQYRELMAEVDAEKRERESQRKTLEEEKELAQMDATEMKRLATAALELLDSSKEQQLLETKQRLAELRGTLTTEKQALAQQYKQKMEEKEEVGRLLELGKRQLQEELMAEKERAHELKIVLKKESTRAEKLNVSLAIRGAEVAALTEKNAELTEESARELKTRCKLSDKIQALEKELEGARSDREDASTQEEALVAENEYLVEKNEELAMKNEELTTRTTELLANLKEVEEQLAKAAERERQQQQSVTTLTEEGQGSDCEPAEADEEAADEEDIACVEEDCCVVNEELAEVPKREGECSPPGEGSIGEVRDATIVGMTQETDVSLEDADGSEMEEPEEQGRMEVEEQSPDVLVKVQQEGEQDTSIQENNETEDLPTCEFTPDSLPLDEFGDPKEGETKKKQEPEEQAEVWRHEYVPPLEGEVTDMANTHHLEESEAGVELEEDLEEIPLGEEHTASATVELTPDEVRKCQEVVASIWMEMLRVPGQR